MVKALLALYLLTVLAGCSPKFSQIGNATFYADRFNGKKTASGVTFRQHKNIAAHRTLPFGTKVKVVNLKNGKSTNVVVADRGPFGKNLLIDLSKSSARKIGLRDGFAQVKIVYKK